MSLNISSLSNILQPIYTTVLQFASDLKNVFALIRIAVFNSIMRFRNIMLLLPRLIVDNPLSNFWRNKMVEAKRDTKTLQRILEPTFVKGKGSSDYRSNKGVEETQTLAACKPKITSEGSQNTYNELKCMEDKINTVVTNKSTHILKKIVWTGIFIFIIVCGILSASHAYLHKFKYDPIVMRMLMSILYFMFGVPYLFFFIFFEKTAKLSELI